MKKIIIFFPFLFSLNVTAQIIEMEYDSETRAAYFQKVIETEGKSKEDLYILAETWIKNTYRSPEDVIKAQIDKTMIRGEGFQSNGVRLTGNVYSDMIYMFKIDSKDNRVRFTVFDIKAMTDFGRIEVSSYILKKDGAERSTNQARYVKESVTSHANSLALSFENSILGVSDTEDEW